MKTLLIHLLILVVVALPAEGQKGRGGEDGGSNIVTGKSGTRSLVPVNVSLVGVNQKNAAAIREGLSSLRHNVYACSRCAVRTHHAGECSHCGEGAELVLVESAPAFNRVGFSTDRGRLIVTVNPHHWASLVELSEVLARSGGGIDRRRFQLPRHCRIKVKGVEPQHASRVRGALVDLEVLERVIVTSDDRGIWIVPLEESRVSVAQIEEVLEKLNPGYEVEDVQWASFCHPCGMVQTMRMGEPNCRGE